MLAAAAMQQHGAHAGANRALDVVSQAVADHHRLARLYVDELERRRKNTRMRELPESTFIPDRPQNAW